VKAKLTFFSLTRSSVFRRCSDKTIWPIIGYTFADGPFRDLVVRFGYDPRKDPEARLFVSSLSLFFFPSLTFSYPQLPARHPS
jgi:hypothetical protein